MLEMWKDIEGYEGRYQISDHGRVRTVRNGKIRAGCCDKDGYLQLAICENGKRIYPKIHRLVANAFIPNPLGLSDVNHKDENKQNNHVSNLEWCTRAYNNQYGSRSKPVVKVKDGIIVDIYKSATEAAKLNNVDRACIVRCCRGLVSNSRGFQWKYA